MPDSSPSSSSSSIWLLSSIKLKFLTRIRRFLVCKSSIKVHKAPEKTDIPTNDASLQDINDTKQTEEVEDDSMTLLLQRAVKRLHFGNWEEKEIGAKEIAKLAKSDVKIRKLMAELRVMPALVDMVVVPDRFSRRCTAVNALIELANGAHTNKVLMLEAGILLKLPKDGDAIDQETRHEFAELLLSLSSLKNSHLLPLESSQIIPFILGCILDDSTSTLDTKETCLGTLYNLSSILDNSKALSSNSLVQALLKLSSIKEISEKALATLGNLVVTFHGKRVLENTPLVPYSLIEILTWEDKPKCQELAAYILMILAHQSSIQRAKMVKSGIVQVLLELALLGSPLAQKRALKLLQWFKDEGQTRMGPHSGPQTGRVSMGSPINQREVQEGKKMMQKLVKESLHKNMQVITKRANGAPSSSRLQAFVISTSSKSLPY